MIRYLTHKLRTQSLNESEPLHSKTDDDHDSGTESDDEGGDIEELENYMENGAKLPARTKHSERAGSSQEVIVDGAESAEKQQLTGACKVDVDSPVPDTALDSALPSDSDHNCDHHSSEEELEVINSSDVIQERNVQYAEKRKWSQANRFSFGENSGASSDEEVRDLMCISAPVEFRSSPPANVPKPSRSLSPPPKLFHSSVGNIPPHELCSVSPRKRHRHTPVSNSSTNLQRPCLDFEKMQQKLVRKHGQASGRGKITRGKSQKLL